MNRWRPQRGQARLADSEKQKEHQVARFLQRNKSKVGKETALRTRKLDCKRIAPWWLELKWLRYTFQLSNSPALQLVSSPTLHCSRFSESSPLQSFLRKPGMLLSTAAVFVKAFPCSHFRKCLAFCSVNEGASPQRSFLLVFYTFASFSSKC